MGLSIWCYWLDSLTWEFFSSLTDCVISHQKRTRSVVFLTALLSILSWLWQPCRENLAELNALPCAFLKFPPWNCCAHPAPKHLIAQVQKKLVGAWVNRPCRQNKKLSCYLSLPKDLKGEKLTVWHTGYSLNMFLPFFSGQLGYLPASEIFPQRCGQVFD